MTEPTTTLIWASAAVAMTSMICLALLGGWRGWLDLRRFEIGAGRYQPEEVDPRPALRIEMADLRERLRKLEAIATGVDP
jgi:hypothetical protein